MRLVHKFFLFLIMGVFTLTQSVPGQAIPGSYSNLSYHRDGKLYLQTQTGQWPARQKHPRYTLQQMLGNPRGTEKGITFDFADSSLNGTLYYGFINYRDSRHPMPVFFRRSSPIRAGKAKITIKGKMSGKYDMIGWEESGLGTLGYRIVDKYGNFLYDGKISFSGKGPFTVIPTLTQGPLVNMLTDKSVVLSFETNQPVQALVKVNDRTIGDAKAVTHHELKISGLEADHTYPYTVIYGSLKQTYSFHSAHAPGSRKPFIFAYASDSRSGNGGGERDIYGTNAYIMKKIMALATQQQAVFMQFTGDLINGYLQNSQQMDLEYANWKHSIGPFAHYFPVRVGMGNHEALTYFFRDTSENRYSIDRFPFDTQSAEAVFARNFVNPLNGPDSEDGAVYDPDPKHKDFPSYKETAYFYTYDNVAVVVLNSNYWYAPGIKYHPETGGNLHAYIMDQQLAWLRATLKKLQKDKAIDHIFITEHTPFFPNGGHTGNDMWYGGSNKPRAVVAGKPVPTGIIERRDQLLDLLVNKTPKVIAILTGDEHNYCRTEIGPDTRIYPEKWTLPRLTLKRTIWQINNGAAGAPYYSQETVPWSDKVQGFTTQNAVVFFHVDGKKINVEVRNPDTLELVDSMHLR